MIGGWNIPKHSRLYTVIACVLGTMADPIFFFLEQDDRVAYNLAKLDALFAERFVWIHGIPAQVWIWLALLISRDFSWVYLRSCSLRAAYAFASFFEFRCLRVARSFTYFMDRRYD